MCEDCDRGGVIIKGGGGTLSGRRGGEVISSKRAQPTPFGPPPSLLVLTNPFVHSILSPRSFFDICKPVLPRTLPYPTSPLSIISQPGVKQVDCQL